MTDIDRDFLAKHTYLSDGRPENLDERLSREIPDTAEPEVPYDRQPDAVGAIVSEPDEDPEDEVGEEQDVLARAEGPARADVGAEEAAMHLLDDDQQYTDEEEDYSAFTSDIEDEGDENPDDEADRDDDSGEFVFDDDEG